MESFPRGGKELGTKRSATMTSKVELKPKRRKIQTKERTARKEKTKTVKRLRLPECGFSWNNTVELAAPAGTSSDDDEEPEEESERKKKKKISAAERREQERQKEREIRQREEALASNQIPNTVDQFDKLVLAYPDSSLLYIQYMAYHLQATEIDKARAVARQAVKMINFMELNELLNVWKAWMNLESRYGTAESLNDVFQEAVKKNEPSKVYLHMLIVHEDAGRKKELKELIKSMTSKFKDQPNTWIKCCSALLKLGMKKKSRWLMQQSLQFVKSSLHAYMLIQFAILENTLGDSEEAESIFEKTLSSYPKNSYVWSYYADSFIKSNNIDFARKVLERACAQTFPMKNMKTLFMKWINLEVKYGTPEAVARVRQMAADYGSKCI
ncbi:PREDICTED: protein RRP5 homolog [Vollenhovia emeryi]|uniref:protein RRP5 homolog n=1 Tax=Vollenhovia emeryi TaxID=411798 RepID=UPI0005F43C5C|nr:PREDICTED: protein RRP5 homolog [Vollenhovia emeryi]XP_011869037.1 PREDICTED: protein RRP5 homolog [Vollenhovia emeryi]